MLIQERYDEILKVLKSEGAVKVSHLVKKFGVSLETVRRDLDYLEKEGKLKKVHGGALSLDKDENALNFFNRLDECGSEKREIADIAIKYIREGSSIALDSGTTTFQVAKALKSKFKNLTVVTNSLRVSNELMGVEGFKVILLGGIINPKEEATVGAWALSGMDNIFVDIAFIAVTGVSLKDGFTDYDLNMIEIQQKLMERAKERIILADSSKFNEVSLLKVSSVDYADYIITDSKINEVILNEFIENGIKVVAK